MSFNIIDNLSIQNHGRLIAEEISRADKFTLISPFLLSDFRSYLADVNTPHLREIQVITTLIPRSPDQVKKITSLITLLDWCKQNDVTCTISLDNNLHGKIYIFQKGNNYLSAIISSANFTNSGLGTQHEWGIRFTDRLTISSLLDSVISCLEYKNLEHADIKKMQMAMENYLAQTGNPPQPKIAMNLLQHISGTAKLKIKTDTNFWLKPIGHSGEYVSPSRSFHQRKDDLHFAKRYPKNITVGDIFIAFAVGSGRIISIYKMLSEPKYAEEVKRWPWYITGKNMSPDYGANWWANNKDIYQLKADFELLHPGQKIKPGEIQGYGGFQWGLDRLKITPSFGEFIIKQIMDYGHY